ncbi:MAG: hypothetical protein ACXWLL_12120 [Myxococcaceae bacterium]
MPEAVMNLGTLGLVMCLAATLAPDAGTPLAPDAGTPLVPAYPQVGLKRPTLLTAPPQVPNGLSIRGRVMVKCRILVTGLLEVIRRWAASARLQPAETSGGKPVEVPYVFNFNFR